MHIVTLDEKKEIEGNFHETDEGGLLGFKLYRNLGS